MPKKKTNKAAAKRFRITANGRIKFKRAGGSHLQSGKSRKRRRSLKRISVLHPAEEKRMKVVLSS